jgi:tryptophanyl-tRNA synthetase
VEPKEIVTPTAALPGLDGRKMSKSYDNAVYLSDDDETVRKKFMNAITDPQRQRRKDPGRPEVCNIHTYHKIYSSKKRVAEIEEQCRTAGIGCVDCKKELIEKFFERFAAIRQKRKQLSDDPVGVRKILDAGAERARKVAEETMKLVRQASSMGWNP